MATPGPFDRLLDALRTDPIGTVAATGSVLARHAGSALRPLVEAAAEATGVALPSEPSPPAGAVPVPEPGATAAPIRPFAAPLRTAPAPDEPAPATAGRPPRIGLYAGSFDPPTLGHLAVIGIGAGLFDSLVVLVATNSAKTPLLPDAERLALLTALVDGLPGVRVLAERERYTVDVAREIGATHLLRGVRPGGRDIEDEWVIAQANRAIGGPAGPETVLVFPPGDLGAVSSTLVRRLIGPPGWEAAVGRYVPPLVLDALRARAGG